LLPDSYVGWAKRAAAVAARLVEAHRQRSEGFDAVLSSSPPDSVHPRQAEASLELKRRFGLPWVADFRDPWMGLALRSPPTRWHRARQASLERKVLAGADLVVAASRTHADMLAGRSQERAGRIARVVHLPNGYEPAATPTAQGDRATVRGDDSPAGGSTLERFHLVFTGTLSQLPDTMVFLEAVHEFLSDRPEARRRLRVSLVGAYDTDYADRALALGLAGIVDFKGQVTHHDTRTLQRAADLLVLWKARGAPTMVPGKIYEYLDAGRPVLALLDAGEEAADLVTRAGGAVVPAGDRVRLTQEIERHYLAWKQGTPISAARPPWLEEHTRARLTARLATLLDGLVEATS